MAKKKNPAAVHRTVTITIVSEDDESERSTLNMTLNIDPPIRQGEESLAMQTVIAMMQSARRDSESWKVKGVGKR